MRLKFFKYLKTIRSDNLSHRNKKYVLYDGAEPKFPYALLKEEIVAFWKAHPTLVAPWFEADISVE